MKMAEFDQHVGHENIRPSIASALERVQELALVAASQAGAAK